MLNKCKCGCSDIRLCVITRITNNGKNRFEKFSYYCRNCGEESEQCSFEYPVDMTLREYIPWRNIVIKSVEASWNNGKRKKEPKNEPKKRRKTIFYNWVDKIKKSHQGSHFNRKRGVS